MKMCPSCEGKNVRALHRSNLGSTYLCGTCQVIFSTPECSPDSLYDKEYYEKNYCSIQNSQLVRVREYVDLMLQFVKPGAMLDYGCGIGIFLAAAREKGFDHNLGADVSSAALELAQSRMGNDDRLLDLTHESIGDNKFDVISFMDSIAHIPDIRPVIQGLLAGNLKEDGVLFIRTPTFSYSRLMYIRLLTHFLSPEYIDQLYFLPKRYFLFNEKSIRVFLESYGLEIVYFEKQQDYVPPEHIDSVKAFARIMLFQKIPHLLNTQNSMVIIAKKKQKKL